MTNETDDNETEEVLTHVEAAPATEQTQALLYAIKTAVRFSYDIQKLRMAQQARATKKAAHAEAILDEKQKTFMLSAAERLHGLEEDAFKEVKRILKGFPIFREWLDLQKGIGPALAGILISSFDIHKATTVSKMWAYSGLAVVNGHAQMRRKGEKANYNPWLKSKMTAILGGSLLKARNEKYTKFYNDYKDRKRNTMIEVCQGCTGTGKYRLSSKSRADAVAPKSRWLKDGVKYIVVDVDTERNIVTVKRPEVPNEEVALDDFKVQFIASDACPNCNGTGGPAPWGTGDAHRHLASLRYMVKMFLLDFYVAWRTIEGLPVRKPYAEEYLNKVHNSGASPTT